MSRLTARLPSCAFLLATTAAVVVATGCGGSGGKTNAGTTTAGTPVAHTPAAASTQHCVDRWNDNLRRTGAINKRLPHITSYGVHVARVHGLCVVIVMRSGQMLLFATHSRNRARTGSDYLLVPTNGRPLRPALRVPNARFGADMTLDLK